MPAFRKSGSVVAFTWAGKLTDPTRPEFAEALAQRRFRTIENAASEEVSSGWCTAGAPSGDHFTPDELDGGPGTWLRVRTDRKTLPKEWLAQYRASAERAKGRRLTARERRELKDDLVEKLLPRALPKVAFTDALLFHEKRVVLLFATSKGARDTFGKLFFESFGVPLQALNALHLAPDELRGAVEKLEPTRWPVARRAS